MNATTCRATEHEPMSHILKFFVAILSRLPTSHSITSPMFVPTEVIKPCINKHKDIARNQQITRLYINDK